MNKLEKAKEIIKENFSLYDCGLFNTAIQSETQ